MCPSFGSHENGYLLEGREALSLRNRSNDLSQQGEVGEACWSRGPHRRAPCLQSWGVPWAPSLMPGAGDPSSIRPCLWYVQGASHWWTSGLEVSERVLPMSCSRNQLHGSRRELFLSMYLFLAVLNFHCYAQAFSSCGKWEQLSSCSVQTSVYSGFSCCGTWALGHVGFSSCGTQV